MSELIKSIQAEKRELNILFSNKYVIDYFQREYKWGRKHVEQLIVDLEAAFIANYNTGHSLEDVVEYNQYYLGPVILADKGNARSIVDGQQRLTSITLLLIFLYRELINSDTDIADDIKRLIISRRGSRVSFNIESPDRSGILTEIFENGVEDIEIENEPNDTIRNIYERYCDIVSMFPDSLRNDVLPLFTDWLREKVVFVEILAYSMDNAYTIFETMNDRGLNLTPTEMMKGYLLTKVGDEDRIEELDKLWKRRISELHSFSAQEDLDFMRAWLRAIYAITIRESVKGSENQDFEKIGTRFHSWIRENAKDIGLSDTDSFYYFIKGDFDFYVGIYKKIKKAEVQYISGLERLYLLSNWSIASSLSYPLLMASISKLDSEDVIIQKIDAVAKFIDIYTISRLLNRKSITQTAIRYTLYTFLKDIRNTSLEELRVILKGKLEELPEYVGNNEINYRFDYADRKFVQYLFARIVFYLEDVYRNADDFWIDDLLVTRKRDRYVLAPLFNYNIDDYPQYFTNYNELWNTFSLLGNHVFIPNPVAQDFIEIVDESKLEYLEKESILAHIAFKPFLTEDGDVVDYGFIGMQELTRENIVARTEQIYRIIREIWNANNI